METGCRNLLSWTLMCCFALLFGSCATTDGGVQLSIAMPGHSTSFQVEEVGVIFAKDRLSGGDDLRIRVLSNDRWMLGTEIEDGWYGLELHSGPIRRGVAVGFPSEWIADAREVYSQGDVRVRLGGRAIEHRE